MRIMTVALGTALVLCNLGTFSAAAHARKAKVVGEPRERLIVRVPVVRTTPYWGLLYCSTISLSPPGRPGRSVRPARSAGDTLWESRGDASGVELVMLALWLRTALGQLRHRWTPARSPLYRQKPTFSGTVGMSALCQVQTSKGEVAQGLISRPAVMVLHSCHFGVRTRREAVAIAITALATSWKHAGAQAQAASAAATLCPTGPRCASGRSGRTHALRRRFSLEASRSLTDFPQGPQPARVPFGTGFSGCASTGVISSA